MEGFLALIQNFDANDLTGIIMLKRYGKVRERRKLSFSEKYESNHRGVGGSLFCLRPLCGIKAKERSASSSSCVFVSLNITDKTYMGTVSFPTGGLGKSPKGGSKVFGPSWGKI